MLFKSGGDAGPGLGMELLPLALALLELFLLRPWRNLRRKLIRLAAAGERGLAMSIPGLEIRPVTKGLPVLLQPFPACGVMCIVSSSSPRLIISSISEASLSELESSILTLPTELEIAVLSTCPMVDHKECATLVGELGTLGRLPFGILFRGGIIIALPDITGDESDEDCSASVE